jgi:hypothetical protein
MRKLALGLVGVGVSSFLGCTAILGSFEVSPTAAAPDGSTDGTADGDVGDGGADADAALPLLNCTVDETKVPTIDNAANGYDKHPFVLRRIDQHTLRMILRRNSATPPGPAFSVVTFSSDSGQLIGTPLDAPINAGQVLDVVQVPNGLGVMTFQYASDGGGNVGALQLWYVDDGAGIGAVPRRLSTDISIANPNNAQLSGHINVIGPDDFFVSFSYPSGALQQWGAGRTPGAANFLDLSNVVASFASAGGPADISGAIHVGSHIAVFDGAGPEGANPTGTSYYVMPDDGNITASVPATPLTPKGGKPVLAIAAFGGVNSASLAAGEVDLTSTTPLVLHAGAVGGAKLTSFTSADLPVIKKYTGAADVPFTNDGPATQFLTKDDLVGLGQGPAPGVKGVNFMWYSVARSAFRADTTSRLLPTRIVQHSNIINDGAIDNPVVAKFQIVWTEITSSPAETLFMANMTCL